MTRAELLSLANRLALCSDPGSRDACIALRKLAELRPVAWTVTSMRANFSGLYGSRHHAEIILDDRAAPEDARMAALYQLSEVLTDE